MPAWIQTVNIEVSTRETPRRRRRIDAPLVNDELSLLWMVNMACIDLNTWYSRVDKLDRPDFVLFDLDPSPDVGFKETVQVALLVKEALDALGLVSFCKTSGADGIHVLVPVERRHTYDDTRRFAEIVAGALALTHRARSSRPRGTGSGLAFHHLSLSWRGCAIARPDPGCARSHSRCEGDLGVGHPKLSRALRHQYVTSFNAARGLAQFVSKLIV